MLLKELNQIEFSGILFDTLFGLVLYFSLDSILLIKNPLEFFFYIFSLIILVHWWLLFKSADDAFEKEVTNSGLDIVIGIIEIILIEFVVLYSKTFDYSTVLSFIISLLITDLVWGLIWRYVGNWKTTNKTNIAHMERELDKTIKVDGFILILYTMLLIVFPTLTATESIVLFTAIYLLYIVLTFKSKIIDIKFF
jgi:hypothetical protein